MNFSFDQIFSQMGQMEEKMKQVKEAMEQLQVSGESGAGMVKIALNGNGEVVELDLDDTLMSESKVVLQDLLKGALNDANSKLKDAKQAKMAEVTGMPMNLFNMGL